MIKVSKDKIFSFLFALILGALISVGLIFLGNQFLKPKYAVFFLDNGSVYFGKIYPWKRFVVMDPIFIQQDTDGSLRVVNFNTLFYAPQNKIYLNPQKVVLWSYLSSNSPLIPYIEGRPPISQPSNTFQATTSESISTSSKQAQ